MIKQKDKDQFFEAMEKEIEVHSSRKHWKVKRTNDMPKGAKVIMEIWSFKRKRLSDGTFLKHKTRLCAHSGQKVGENLLGNLCTSSQLSLSANCCYCRQNAKLVFTVHCPCSSISTS